jgi:hypothetical protein
MLSVDFADSVDGRTLLIDGDDVIIGAAELPAALVVDIVDGNVVVKYWVVVIHILCDVWTGSSPGSVVAAET